MSNVKNNMLLVRAYELVEQLLSDPAGRDKLLLQLIEKNDLEELMSQVIKIEGDMAREEFYNNGILEQNDIY